MAVATAALIIGAAGLGLAGAGAVMQYQGQKKQAEAQEQAISAQREADALRQRQLNLDAARRKREIIRSALAARAQSAATLVAQGAAGNGSSAVGGAAGSISGRTNVNLLGVSQNQEIGNAMFSANQNMFNAYRDSARAGAGIALGAGLSSLGGAMMKNNETIAKIGNSASGFLRSLA